MAKILALAATMLAAAIALYAARRALNPPSNG